MIVVGDVLDLLGDVSMGKSKPRFIFLLNQAWLDGLVGLVACSGLAAWAGFGGLSGWAGWLG